MALEDIFSQLSQGWIYVFDFTPISLYFNLNLPVWIRIRVRTRNMDTDPHRSWKRIQFGSGSTTLLFILHIQILHAISRGYLVVVTGINCWGTFWAGISIIRVCIMLIYTVYMYTGLCGASTVSGCHRGTRIFYTKLY